MTTFETKDSGERVEFASGMKRDVQTDKPRYDLIPLSALTRLADLYTRGAEKYGDCNWQKANSDEEIQRFKGSAFRHFIQFLNGERDEDHGIAVVWNIFALIWLEEKQTEARNLEDIRHAMHRELASYETKSDRIVKRATELAREKRGKDSHPVYGPLRPNHEETHEEWTARMNREGAQHVEKMVDPYSNKLGVQPGIQLGGVELPELPDDGRLGER